MMVVFISYYEVVVPILIGCDDCSYFNILYLKGGFKMEQWQFERIAEVFYCFFKEKYIFFLENITVIFLITKNYGKRPQ